MVGPNLLRHAALVRGKALPLVAACRDTRAPDREVDDLKLETAEAEAMECKPRLREAMGPIERAKGREAELSTILTDFVVCEDYVSERDLDRNAGGRSYIAT